MPTTPQTFHCRNCGQPLTKSGTVFIRGKWVQRWVCSRHPDGRGCGAVTHKPKE